MYFVLYNTLREVLKWIVFFWGIYTDCYLIENNGVWITIRLLLKIREKDNNYGCHFANKKGY